MFKNSKAFSSFSVNDLRAAQLFYAGRLGLDVKENEMGILELQITSGIPVIIYPKPDHVPATHTVLNFPVDDIDQAVDRLIDAGITFEQYGGAIATDEKGISHAQDHRIAWFKDPAGNILSVVKYH